VGPARRGGEGGDRQELRLHPQANLVNEALPFLIVDDPEFYDQALSGVELSIDFGRSQVSVGGTSYRARGATPMIQALTRAGGLVPAIQRYGNEVFGALATGGA
jgi:hypothetical protein